MSAEKGKIGVFDSGIGGLTILRALLEGEPDYDYLYLGDSARAPYGGRSFETILNFTLEAVEYLFQNNCQIIIIACNTASAKALRTIQQKFLPKHYPERRVLGIIRPSTEKLPEKSSSIAIWGTSGTVNSNSYAIELEKFAPGIRVVQQACPLLVPLIENGETGTPASRYAIQKYWHQTLDQNPSIDTVLLACTHYPLIRAEIQNLLPKKVSVLVQSEFITPSWSLYLKRHPEMEVRLSQSKGREFLTTDEPSQFNHLAQYFLGEAVESRRVRI